MKGRRLARLLRKARRVRNLSMAVTLAGWAVNRLKVWMRQTPDAQLPRQPTEASPTGASHAGIDE